MIGAIITILIICCSTHILSHKPDTKSNENKDSFVEKVYRKQQLQQTALQRKYDHQRHHEVKNTIGDMFSHYDANWPCVWGETFLVGGDPNMTSDKMAYGAKWGCGLELMSAAPRRECIVYSIGSNNDFSFEEGIADLLPHCKIFTFDPTVKSPKVPAHIADKVQFLKWGLSGSDTGNYLLLSTMMRRLKHSHIDILKVDVEGSEWPAFFALDAMDDAWPDIGQLLIEIHIWKYTLGGSGYTPERPDDNTHTLGTIIELFERHDLRLFHKEVNAQWGSTCCSEFSFIHKDWHPEKRPPFTNV